MQNVVLILHLIIAVCLIATVLLQRSEGGALGIGGGGGGGINTRPRVTPVAKLTWGLAVAFLTTSITLAIMAGGDPTGQSLIEGGDAPAADGILLPDLPAEGAQSGTVPPAADDAAVLPDLPAGGDGGQGTSSGGGRSPVAPPAAE